MSRAVYKMNSSDLDYCFTKYNSNYAVASNTEQWISSIIEYSSVCACTCVLRGKFFRTFIGLNFCEVSFLCH